MERLCVKVVVLSGWLLWRWCTSAWIPLGVCGASMFMGKPITGISGETGSRRGEEGRDSVLRAPESVPGDVWVPLDLLLGVGVVGT